MKQPTARCLRILFLIQDLNHGGAQRQLSLLARGLRARGHEVGVAVFYPGGPLTAELTLAGVRLYPLDKRGRWDLAGFLWRLWRCLRVARPQVLHGYLMVSNLLVAFMGAGRPGLRVVWGLRASDMQTRHYDWTAGLIRRLECRLSGLADLCISNSEAGRRHAVAAGFPASRLRVVANGIDTERFQPDPAAGLAQRRHWGVPPDTPLIGLVARLDPMKDHPTFLAMAARLLARRPALRLVCVGGGPTPYRAALQAEARRLGLHPALLWAGDCTAMAAVYNALDLLVSSSAFGEGFANVIGEAMACQVPCVVTAVGDGAIIVGDTGAVVPPADPRILADACEHLLAMPARRRQQGQRARKRIMERYSVARLVTDTEQLLDCVVTHRRTPAPQDESATTDL